MIEILDFSLADVIAGRDAVLGLQGIPTGAAVSARIETVLAEALALLAQVAAPAGMMRELAIDEFRGVYNGNGLSTARTPIGDIYGRAEALALHAVTLGPGVSREIKARFGANEYALGSMLDSAASIAADNLVALVERRFHDQLTDAGRANGDIAVLGYSPGYCGWHISAQRRLFDSLDPGRIGIALGDSFLMQPVKSVTGVLVAGPKEIHKFRCDYPTCNACKTHTCRKRIQTLG